MKGYKATNNDMTCRGYQFELDKTFTLDGPLKICNNGFHFCQNVQDVFEFYDSYTLRIFEVEAFGDIITKQQKSCALSIKFVRELTTQEIIDAIANSSYHSEKYLKRLAVNMQLYRDLTNNVVRKAVAQQGYGLDILIDDPDEDVRAAVAQQGYGLSQLVNDQSSYVRMVVAEQGYGLDILINDRNANVRTAVAQRGYGLDTLITDQDSYVRYIAIQSKSKQSGQ